MTKSLCLFLSLGLAAPAFSAVNWVNSVAGLANPLENNGGGARALGMGSAFVGVADDSTALFWNPAGLGGLRSPELALHHNSWLAGIVQETLVGSYPLRGLGSVGAALNYVNYGVLDGYDEAGNLTESYSPSRMGLAAGWGLPVAEELSAGLTVKGSLQTLDDASYGSLAVDVGALWTPDKVLRVGLAMNNLGTSVAGFAVASALRGGASYRFNLARDNQLLVAASAAWEPDGVSRLQIGAEDLLFFMLAVRLGYQANLADNQIWGLSGLSAGLGLFKDGFNLDYAFLPYGDLGGAHRLSLGYRFGS